jgi:uncharacterized protein YraI
MRRTLAVIFLAALLAASCGDDATTSSSSTTGGSSTSTAGPSTTGEGTTAPETTTTNEPPTTTTAPPEGSYAVEAVETCVIGSSPGGNVNVRSGPGPGFDLVGTLEAEATGVAATGWAVADADGDEWRQISFEGADAWIFSAFLTPGACTTGDPVDYCSNDDACTDVPNIRTGLGGTYPVVGTLPRNAVAVHGTGATAEDTRDRTWVQVRDGDSVGWVAGWLLEPEPCGATTCSPPDLPWTITAAGFGPIRIGMSLGDLDYLTDYEWTWEEPAAEGCLASHAPWLGTNLQADDGLVVDHINIGSPGAGITAEGIRVGSTHTALNAAYGADVISFGPAGYGDYAAKVDLDNDGAADMLAMFDGTGMSQPITSIRLPAVLIEGGCT